MRFGNNCDLFWPFVCTYNTLKTQNLFQNVASSCVAAAEMIKHVCMLVVFASFFNALAQPVYTLNPNADVISTNRALCTVYIRTKAVL